MAQCLVPEESDRKSSFQNALKDAKQVPPNTSFVTGFLGTVALNGARIKDTREVHITHHTSHAKTKFSGKGDPSTTDLHLFWPRANMPWV